MSIWIGPETAPQTHALDVSAAEPWQAPSLALLRGMGGRSVAVWTSKAPEAGQRLTVRCPPEELPALLATLHTPGRLVISTDDPACPILTGTGIVRSTRSHYRYDLAPTAADVDIEWERA